MLMQFCLLLAQIALQEAEMNPFNVLCFFLLSLTIAASVTAIESPSRSSSCHPDQRDALSRFNHSLSISDPSYVYNGCLDTSYPKTVSWRKDKDCCSWEGVVCDNSTGDVVGLDLSCAWLRGTINSSSPVFSLRHLRILSLFGNDLLRSSIPPEIRVFSQMTHLNLSGSKILGNVPSEISHLSKLVSLDLSNNFGLEMQNPTMRMLVRNLTQLEELNLSDVDLSTVVPTSLMNFTSTLISLRLFHCSLGGKFPDYIFQLPNLQEIDLSGNDLLNGTLPQSNWSSSLSFLSLGSCSFSGELPHSIGSLVRLTYLDLSGYNFTGHVDFGTFSTLENLHFLGLSGVSISGEDATDANPKFPKLETLDITDGTLKNFPCFLPSMPELRVLSADSSIVSEFPGQCVNNGPVFPQLQRSRMRSCNLTKFPYFLSHAKKLRFLDLSGNMIEEIPGWFWGIGIDTLERLYLEDNLIKGGLRLPWKRLVTVGLENNSFEGPLPIPLPPSVSDFIVGQNRFNGSISPSVCQQTSLFFLVLRRNNLTGVIPQCLGNLTDLMYLDLSSNSLIGPLPPSLANCTSMETLDVSYNSIGGAPPIWIPTISLKELLLQANNFVGQWPGDIFLRSTSLFFIDLSINKFEGPPPLPSYAVNYYSISNNSFSGEISSLICNATNLQLLDLSNNGITGTLPHCLKNVFFSLEYFNIRVNEFHRSIPEIFHEGRNLRFLDFSRNQFEGSLPRTLSNCKGLEVLDVGSNNIVDSFPNWLGDLPLKVLSLRSNKFHGCIDDSNITRLFSELRILDLSSNGFDCSLSDNLITELFGMTRMDVLSKEQSYMAADLLRFGFSNTIVFDGQGFYSVMTNLKGVEKEMVKINVQDAFLDLSSNHFRGKIPKNIGLLKSLRGLNLSHNSFTGTIPQSVGNLTNLEWLDLSYNNLDGGIPRELVKLSFLEALDLSWNNLTGPIPSGPQFNTFSNSSFEGNPGLCGTPLTRACGQGRADVQPPPDQRDNGGWFEWKFVAMGFGSGVGIGISLGYMALEMGRPLWLARVVAQLEARCSKRSKRKAPRRNARR